MPSSEATFGVDREALLRDARDGDSTPRTVSMALCRTVGGHRPTVIAAARRLTSYTPVSRDASLRHRTEQLEERLGRQP